jgi:hypothetical protein
MKDKEREKAAVADWLILLHKNETTIRNFVLELRRSSGEGIQSLMAGETKVLAMREAILVAWMLILQMRAPVAFGKPAHPWLGDYVGRALLVGDSEGWEARGFVTCAARLIACSMLMEKILLTLFEMAGDFDSMMRPEVEWVRTLLMFGAD